MRRPTVTKINYDYIIGRFYFNVEDCWCVFFVVVIAFVFDSGKDAFEGLAGFECFIGRHNETVFISLDWNGGGNESHGDVTKTPCKYDIIIDR